MPKFTYLCHHLGSSGPPTKLAQHGTLALRGSVSEASCSNIILCVAVVQPSCSTARHVHLPGLLYVYEKGSCHVITILFIKENVGTVSHQSVYASRPNTSTLCSLSHLLTLVPIGTRQPPQRCFFSIVKV